jgi:hypothetical protein
MQGGLRARAFLNAGKGIGQRIQRFILSPRAMEQAFAGANEKNNAAGRMAPAAFLIFLM